MSEREVSFDLHKFKKPEGTKPDEWRTGMAVVEALLEMGEVSGLTKEDSVYGPKLPNKYSIKGRTVRYMPHWGSMEVEYKGEGRSFSLDSSKFSSQEVVKNVQHEIVEFGTNPQEITYEKIGWPESVSERNKLVVKGLLEMGTPVGRRITVPVGDKPDGGTVAPPTEYDVDGVEVFVSIYRSGFYQAHVDGVEASPSPFLETESEEILAKIRRETDALRVHPDRKFPKA